MFLYFDEILSYPDFSNMKNPKENETVNKENVSKTKDNALKLFVKFLSNKLH
jgi:hypothetical protein